MTLSQKKRNENRLYIFKIECGVRQGGVLPTVRFAIKELWLIVRVGDQYMGGVVYADDIALLAGSCYGLQKITDICTEYGHNCDIIFNLTKNQLLTMGEPDTCTQTFSMVQ